MKHLQRWSETGGPGEADLMNALTDARRAPSAAQLDALSAGVLARLAEHAGEPTAELRAPAVTWRRAARWPSIILSAALFGTGAWSLGAGLFADRAPEQAPAAVAPPPAQAPAVPVRGDADRSRAEEVITAPTPQVPAKARTPHQPRRTQAEARPEREMPRDEVGLLQAAQRALVLRPERSVALAQEHQQRFPHGLFGEEREAIRIEALFRLGRYAEAERQRARFLARYPRSTYRERLERLRARGPGAQPPAGAMK